MLAALPRHLQDRIALEAMALGHNTVTQLDLDDKISLLYGIIWANRHFHRLGDQAIHEHAYKSSISTSQSRCTFNGFDALKRLLRKEFTREHKTTYTIGDSERLHVVLDLS